VVTIVAGVWVRQAEIVVIATQISESVPAIPALGALILLVALNLLLRAIRRQAQLNRTGLIGPASLLPVPHGPASLPVD
jgi:hypothetical protein